MPTLTDIRTAIKATMQTVPSIGVVHERERFAKTNTDFAALFVDPAIGTLRGWVIRRVSTREERPASGRYVVTHRWQIRGYMAFEDAKATESIFDNLIEQIRDAFRADDSLGGVVMTCSLEEDDGAAGIQVEDSGPVMFANLLAHGCRLSLATRHVQ